MGGSGKEEGRDGRGREKRVRGRRGGSKEVVGGDGLRKGEAWVKEEKRGGFAPLAMRIRGTKVVDLEKVPRVSHEKPFA